MRIPALLTATLLAGSMLFAQDDPKPPIPPDAKASIIPVTTLTGDSFNRLVRLLRVFDVPIQADDQLRTILVYSSPEVVEQVRAVVAELDKPGSQAAIGRNVEMSLTFLRCPATPTANAPALPAELEPVARELRNAMLCRNVEFWSTVPLRLQEGKPTETSLRLPHPDYADMAQTAALAQINMSPTSVGTRDEGRYVRFNAANVSLRVPDSPDNKFQWIDVGLRTSGDFFESQNTVLGKLSAEIDIFIVISLKILE
jgi:hypothetical protein